MSAHHRIWRASIALIALTLLIAAAQILGTWAFSLREVDNRPVPIRGGQACGPGHHWVNLAAPNIYDLSCERDR
jgi:hypothetical protein